jgi:hypothetical protein
MCKTCKVFHENGLRVRYCYDESYADFAAQLIDSGAVIGKILKINYLLKLLPISG